MKERILAALLTALLIVNISSCNFGSKSEIEEPSENIDTTGSNFEETEGKIKESEANAETVDIESEYDPATYMRYTLNDDGKSYSVCPAGLPDVVKELVIPGEYKGLPVTKIEGKFFEHSIETIIISEGIKTIVGGFFYRCSDIKNIYLPTSIIHIGESAFNCRPTMGAHGSNKSNVIEKIVVAEGNPYYYVDGNCLIDRRSQKIILGCNSSIIPNDGSVKSIGEAAFANCHSIEIIIIPKSITEIEDYAFYNCDNLKQVYITSSAAKDEKIVHFGEEAFYTPGLICYVPDAESVEIYFESFGLYPKLEIGIP